MQGRSEQLATDQYFQFRGAPASSRHQEIKACSRSNNLFLGMVDKATLLNREASCGMALQPVRFAQTLNKQTTKRVQVWPLLT